MDNLWEISIGENGFVQLIDRMGSDGLVSQVATVTYGGISTGPDNDRWLIGWLIENNFMSPFEYVSFVFVIKAPLFVRSQIQRHRSASLNEISRRYTSQDIEFYYPETWLEQKKELSIVPSNGPLAEAQQERANNVLRTHSRDSLKRYQQLLDMGVALEQARLVLPQNLMTKFFWKVSLVDLFDFLERRNRSFAQRETRMYAQAIANRVARGLSWSKHQGCRQTVRF